MWERCYNVRQYKEDLPMDNRKALRSRIITLTIPIVIQNLLSAAVGSADVLMINCV